MPDPTAAPSPTPAAPAPADAAPAAPSPAPGAPAPAPEASAPAAPAPAPAASTLFSAAPGPAPAGVPAADGDGEASGLPEWLPEKYRVLDGDGKLDLQASSQKLAEGYAAAAKRIGTGDLPPEAPDGYKDFTPPEAFKDVQLDPDLSRSFRERAHKAGLTQSQFDFVMGEYFNVVPEVLNAAASVSADEARAELSKVWSTPAELEANMTAAERAVSQVPQALQEQIKAKYGTDPLFWQFAAVYGREAREDRPPAPAGGAASVTDTDALMRSEAYRNSKHPDHEKVSRQVSEAFQKRHGTQPAIA